MCFECFAPSVVDVSYQLAAAVGSFACASLLQPERLTWPIYRWDSGTSSERDPVNIHQAKGEKTSLLKKKINLIVMGCSVN